MNSQNDIHYMHSALNMARRGLGRTAPNPSVGCVLVKDGHVIARARTGDGGRPHAEFLALQDAGGAAQGATVYVTLEPCAHVGETPSCAQELVRAGISRVVVARGDPDPRTAGQGIQILKAGGVEVMQGVLEEEATVLNAGFFRVIKAGQPFVTMKVATSKDEKIAGGDGRWITGEVARARGHLLRAQHDGILVGSGTVLADNPLLTTRVPGVEHEIKRFVLDTNFNTPPNAKLYNTPPSSYILHNSNRKGEYSAEVGLLRVEDLGQALREIAEQGVTRLLVEGGQGIYGAFLAAGFVDELAWFQAPHEIGAQGLSALPQGTLKDAVSAMDLVQEIRCGEDLLAIYRKRL